MIAFIIGFIIGGLFGFGLMACIAGGKDKYEDRRTWYNDEDEDTDDIDDEEDDE